METAFVATRYHKQSNLCTSRCVVGLRERIFVVFLTVTMLSGCKWLLIY